MIYIVRINDKEYEVEVEKGKANIANITTIQAPVAAPAAPSSPAVTAQEPPKSVQPAAPVANIGNGEPVKAPMPGVVLDIKVSPGQAVKKGQILLILEAMKMENEVLAQRDCTVEQVLVSKGANVNTNDILLTIK